MNNENIKAITDFLFIEDDIDSLKRSDLVLFLCNNNINGMALVFDQLYKKHVIDDNTKIIFSGDTGSLDKGEVSESKRLSTYLTDNYGYDKDIFILEDKATNIYENLLFSKDLIGDFEKYNNILFVGAAFALRRIKLCATKLLYPIDRISYVGIVSDRKISKDEWFKTDSARSRVFEEIERIGKYLIKGDLDIK